MPCYDGRPTDEQVSARKLGAVKAALDRRTDMLCRTLKSLEENVKHIYDVLPADIREWHREHKAHDALREAQAKKAESKK